MNNFGYVSIVFEYDMTCARVYRVKCLNFSNICIRIRMDFYMNDANLDYLRHIPNFHDVYDSFVK